MKATKKIVAALVVLMMIVAMLPNVFADGDNHTITITNTVSGYEYKAYKIFSGEMSDGKLTEITWGPGASSAVQAALISLVELADQDPAATAMDVAAAISANPTKFTGKAVADAIGGAALGTAISTTSDYVFEDMETGYYFIKNTKVPEGIASYSSFIVNLFENDDDVVLTPKADVPSMTKKVMDTNDTTGETSGWQDTADYDIGDEVPFQLIANLPNNVSSYDSYMIKFTDTMDAGLTFKAVTKIVVAGTTIFDAAADSQWTIDDDQQGTVHIDGANQSLTVTFDNLKGLGVADLNSKTVEVYFSATLNQNAKIGHEGNINKANLTFSNNPNVGGEGDTGKTPDDAVIVFTYKVVVNKVDEKGDDLTGASFQLFKVLADGTEKNLGVVSGDSSSSFTWTGLDDGNYKLVETVAPSGYNKLKDPIVFKVEAAHVVTSDVVSNNGDLLTTLSGDKVTGEITFTRDTEDEDALTASIENKAGTVLPETGGIGTTIFYVVGSVLVVGAVILLVSKKRMSIAD